MEPTSKFTIERIDEKTAKKKDNTESVTILNMDILRQQKEELEQEVEIRQRSILRDIPILNSVPTDPPKYQISFALYENGSTRRFYVFFNGVWRYATLT